MRHLATVKEINFIKPHFNADRLEVVFIGGWSVVVGKGEFKLHDKVIYFEPDSLIPVDENSVFVNLQPYCKEVENSKSQPCILLQTKKIRGQISQGLVCHLSDLFDEDLPLDTDVSERLRIEKYDPPEVDCTAETAPWPSFLTKTDEDRIQNKLDFLEWLCSYEKAAELVKHFTATEKLDGTSTTFFRTNKNGVVRYGVCSRNKELITDDGSVYWKNYNHYKMKDWLDKLAELCPSAYSVAIQGESIGIGINGNRLNRKAHEFYIFNVLVDGQRLDPYTFPFPNELLVPRLQISFPLKSTAEATMQSLIDLSNGRKSVLSPDRLAEGIVWRFDVQVPDGFSCDWKHFKAINNSYLLKFH